MDFYQKAVNALTGAMGPTNTAYWNAPVPNPPNDFDPSTLDNQPLYISPGGQYEVSFDANADQMSEVLPLPQTMEPIVSFGKRGRRGSRRRYTLKGPRKGLRRRSRRGSRRGPGRPRRVGRPRGSRKGHRRH